jgi:hypothetical protein
LAIRRMQMSISNGWSVGWMRIKANLDFATTYKFSYLVFVSADSSLPRIFS